MRILLCDTYQRRAYRGEKPEAACAQEGLDTEAKAGPAPGRGRGTTETPRAWGINEVLVAVPNSLPSTNADGDCGCCTVMRSLEFSESNSDTLTGRSEPGKSTLAPATRRQSGHFIFELQRSSQYLASSPRSVRSPPPRKNDLLVTMTSPARHRVSMTFMR